MLLFHSISNPNFPSQEKEVVHQNEQKSNFSGFKISYTNCDYQKNISHLLTSTLVTVERRQHEYRQLWEAALTIDLIFVVSRGTVLASLLPGPLKYRDFPSLSTPQPVPTWPPVILYQRGLSFLSNLSNISLWLGTLDTQVPCDASRKKKKREMLWWNCAEQSKGQIQYISRWFCCIPFEEVAGFSKKMPWRQDYTFWNRLYKFS